MFKHFITLEWKAFFRSASVGKSIALKILLGFIAIYFLTAFLLLGITLYPLFQDSFPDLEPLEVFNSFVIYWLAVELILRFFMQSLPVMNIKPLMTLPIKKEKVVHFVLLKSLFSIYNVFSLLVIIPFGVFCFLKGNYELINILIWMLSIYSLALIVNYSNFLIKKKFAENIKVFILFVILGFTLVGLEYFEVFKTSTYVGSVLDILVKKPLLAIIPILILFGLYFWNFYYLKNNFYLDNSLKSKIKDAKTADLNWVKHFGEIAPFLQLDLKLISRNKRPRATAMLSLFFIAYFGFIMFANAKSTDIDFGKIMGGIIMTGFFMINFGQFIPSWDSNYYSMLMVQNIPIKKYLKSKEVLLTTSIMAFALLPTPLAFININYFLVILSCALFNIGINVPIMLYGGSFNKKRIDFEKSPFMNYQGTGATQWILALPLFVFPILIFLGFSLIFNNNTGLLTLALFGVSGLISKKWLMNKITEGYINRKYATINGFKQQEN